jgi:hypothetical protein
MTPWKSVAFDAFAGVLTAISMILVISTTPFWPHGMCATGVNEPVQYAVGAMGQLKADAPVGPAVPAAAALARR